MCENKLGPERSPLPVHTTRTRTRTHTTQHAPTGGHTPHTMSLKKVRGVQFAVKIKFCARVWRDHKAQSTRMCRCRAQGGCRCLSMLKMHTHRSLRHTHSHAASTVVLSSTSRAAAGSHGAATRSRGATTATTHCDAPGGARGAPRPLIGGAAAQKRRRSL